MACCWGLGRGKACRGQGPFGGRGGGGGSGGNSPCQHACEASTCIMPAKHTHKRLLGVGQQAVAAGGTGVVAGAAEVAARAVTAAGGYSSGRESMQHRTRACKKMRSGLHGRSRSARISGSPPGLCLATCSLRSPDRCCSRPRGLPRSPVLKLRPRRRPSAVASRQQPWRSPGQRSSEWAPRSGRAVAAAHPPPPAAATRRRCRLLTCATLPSCSRPRTISDVAHQEEVVATLQHALSSGNVRPARRSPSGCRCQPLVPDCSLLLPVVAALPALDFLACCSPPSHVPAAAAPAVLWPARHRQDHRGAGHRAPAVWAGAVQEPRAGAERVGRARHRSGELADRGRH